MFNGTEHVNFTWHTLPQHMYVYYTLRCYLRQVDLKIITHTILFFYLRFIRRFDGNIVLRGMFVPAEKSTACGDEAAHHPEYTLPLAGK